MSTFRIHTLGCGSAKPTLRHQPSSTVVEFRDNLFMVDCGEGAQLAFQRQHLRFSRLRHIFLTHLHGDHVLGLPGLISSLALGGTGGAITIHTFAEGIVLDTPSLTVRTIPLEHRVPTVGYVFEEKPKQRHILRDMIDYHQVPTWQIRLIKEGADFIKPDGTIIPNSFLTTDATPSLSYAHISDTAYMPGLAEKIGPVDLLFHETTYTEQHKAEAATRGHSTARQAATVARDAGARALLTGHYSSRYTDDTIFLKEAQEIFPKVILNREGLFTPLD